jgi:hypothetical protein
VDFQGTSHWYLSAIIHQDKEHNITIYQARYGRSIVTSYLDGEGVKRLSSAHNNDLPMDFITTIEEKANAMQESNKLQESYTIDYASYISSIV